MEMCANKAVLGGGEEPVVLVVGVSRLDNNLRFDEEIRTLKLRTIKKRN